MTMRWMPVLCAGLLLVAAGGAGAQDRPMFRCNVKGKVTYQHTPCPGGKQVNAKKAKKTDPRTQKPPQDRAKAANRARLTPEDRKTCEGLEVTIPQLEDGVKARGAAASPEDERSLTEAKKKFRELKC